MERLWGGSIVSGKLFNHPSCQYFSRLEGGHQKISQDILNQIFPYPTTTTSTNYHLTTSPDDCPFTPKDIARVINSLPHGKAPGYDGIDNLVLKTINKNFSLLFIEFFNRCLSIAKFSNPFKISNIILI
ncbi:hypothetical protein AVEN_179483-1 [Araneus ventricosus]|uniref:Reverse transcriptase domain-containing protein n=1 Tax=Araneus ventricosus TaxID=182803 RepID=A0A4Y2BFQ8_ARAVE|nr:hypothetical protein AVEN_179483-1 [Araneus ventricosus]